MVRRSVAIAAAFGVTVGVAAQQTSPTPSAPPAAQAQTPPAAAQTPPQKTSNLGNDANGNPLDGDIAVTGFPIPGALGLYPVTHRGIVAAITPFARPAASNQQLDANIVRRLRNNFAVLQLDITAYPGNSGSPVYDAATGDVLGVVNSVLVRGGRERALSAPSGITYAVPIQHLRPFLTRHKVIP